MKVLGCFLAFAILPIGCATLVQRSSKLDLASVEALQIGKTTGADLRARYGDPERTAALSKNEIAWIYVDHDAKAPFQRASFVLDVEKNSLLTATWIPSEGDPFGLKDAAVAHFKNASFQVKDVGWIARHAYSNEAFYFDQALGVSIRVNQASNEVLAIAFGGKLMPPLAKKE